MPVALRPLALAVMLAALPAAAIAESGKLFFLKGDVTVVGVDGASRPARPGESIASGERIVTGPDALAQLRTADGGLMSVRPESNVRLDRFSSPEGGRVVIDAGSIRVINLPSPGGGAKPMPIQLQAAGGTVTLQGADAETAVRRADANVPAPEGGLITRVNAGTALAVTSNGTVPLPVASVNVASAGAIRPAPIEALPPIRIAPGAANTAIATPPALAGVRPPAPPTGPLGFTVPVTQPPSLQALGNVLPTTRVGGTATFTPTVGTVPLTPATRPGVTAGTAVDLLVNASLQPKDTPTTVNVGGVTGTVQPTRFTNVTLPPPPATMPTTTQTTFVPTTTLAPTVQQTTILQQTPTLTPTTTTVFVPRTTYTAPTTTFTGNVLTFGR